MSVYKEGFYAVKEIEKQARRIFLDACDYGTPVRKGDKLWNLTKQLVQWYRVRKDYYSNFELTDPGMTRKWDGVTLTEEVELISEADIDRGTEYRYKVTYVPLKDFKRRSYNTCSWADGYVEIELLYVTTAEEAKAIEEMEDEYAWKEIEKERLNS